MVCYPRCLQLPLSFACLCKGLITFIGWGSLFSHVVLSHEESLSVLSKDCGESWQLESHGPCIASINHALIPQLLKACYDRSV